MEFVIISTFLSTFPIKHPPPLCKKRAFHKNHFIFHQKEIFGTSNLKKKYADYHLKNILKVSVIRSVLSFT